MARQKGTAATVLLVLLALVLLVLALSGNASVFFRKLMEWLTGGKWSPPERKGKGEQAGGGGGSPAKEQAPSPNTTPGYEWSPAPSSSTVPYGPPAPAPKQADPKQSSKNDAPPVRTVDPMPEILAILGTIGVQLSRFIPATATY